MMGYELYRQLSNKKSRKKKGKSCLEEKEKNDSSLYGKRKIQLKFTKWIVYKTRDILCITYTYYNLLYHPLNIQHLNVLIHL